MSKVNAFTILEMLVNLTIMSIIMGLIYFAYASFVQQVINYQRSIDEQNELTSAYVQLRTDFYTADRVVSSYKSFETIPYNDKGIVYKITDEYLIRKQATLSDTLSIKGVNIVTEKNKVTNEDLVTELTINTTLFDEPIEFTVIKEYTPNLKIKM